MRRWHAALCSLVLALAGPAVAPADEPAPAEGQGEAPAAAPPAPLDVAEARRRAELLHAAVHSTLHSVHHRYYREDEGLAIPARTLVRDLFADLQRDQGVLLRWLVVDGQAMNDDHKPRTPFEKQAAKALHEGRSVWEEQVDGVYRRAAPIKLTNACLKCHVPDRKDTAPRTAGLIIAMPIK